jgi:hypothetical protein
MGGIRRYGNILVYPARGRLIFATDFHGQLADFRRVVSRFQARVARGEDLYLLFAGDFVHGPRDEQVSGWLKPDDSLTILTELEALLAEHPDRVHSLLGNHEHGHLGGPKTQKFYRGIDDDVTALERRLGAERTAEIRSLFSSFALVALTPCGVMFSHAAPGVSATTIADIAAARLDRADRSVMELLWPRVVSNPDRLDATFEMMKFGGITPRIAAYGHDVVPSGVDRESYRQVVISTSFAIPDRHKLLLELDLSRQYQDTFDLREGIELVHLYPEKALGRPLPA